MQKSDDKRPKLTFKLLHGVILRKKSNSKENVNYLDNFPVNHTNRLPKLCITKLRRHTDSISLTRLFMQKSDENRSKLTFNLF